MAQVAVGSNGATAVAAERAPRPARGLRIVLAIASGLLLAASFPSLDIEPLAWIGLVPLLFASRGLGVAGPPTQPVWSLAAAPRG